VFKTGAFLLISYQFLFETRVFLLISYRFLLVFTLIFTLKTNKSYKITLFTTASHLIFQKNCQKPLISQLFSLFLFSFSFYPFTFAFCPPKADFQQVRNNKPLNHE